MTSKLPTKAELQKQIEDLEAEIIARDMRIERMKKLMTKLEWMPGKPGDVAHDSIGRIIKHCAICKGRGNHQQNCPLATEIGSLAK